jgi:hypothetical protein
VTTQLQLTNISYHISYDLLCSCVDGIRIDMYFCVEWRIIEYCSNTDVFHVVHNTNALREDHIGPSAYRFSHIDCRS